MDAYLMEWGSLLIRWLHVITAIAWIGSSFFFMHLDASIRATPTIPPGRGGGAAWQVHGGGFYEMRKYLVAPERMPEELTWHKWQSYWTWISGFFLLCWMYYGQSELYLIDPAVRDLSPYAAGAIGIATLAVGWLFYDTLCKSPLGKNEPVLGALGFAYVVAAAWGFSHVFSGRGALLHTGALMATLMTANVFFIIIPNQKKVIADLVAGKAPDPALGKQAKQRSTHNNYITLPVLFLMLSNHYPLTYSTVMLPGLVALVLIAGGLIRYSFNEHHAGRGWAAWAWVVAALAIWTAIWLTFSATDAGRETLGLAPRPERVTDDARALAALAPDRRARLTEATSVIRSRCSMCHAAQPVWAGIGIAPKGVLLEGAGDVLRHREAIRVQAVLTRAMPPNNVTQMTPEERRAVAAWLAGAS